MTLETIYLFRWLYNNNNIINNNNNNNSNNIGKVNVLDLMIINRF